MPQTTVAAAIIFEGEGEDFVLLTKRSGDPFKDMWCLPGGHINKNEQAADAIIREVKEETGLDVLDLDPIGWRDEIVPNEDIHNVVLLYACKVDGEITPQDGEVSDWNWYPLGQAEQMKLAFDHQELIKLL
jgi:8-oxo-dGTP diphosphatase